MSRWNKRPINIPRITERLSLDELRRRGYRVRVVIGEGPRPGRAARRRGHARALRLVWP